MTAFQPPFSRLPAAPAWRRLLPAGINHLLAREAWARERLAAHAGKTVAVTIASVDIALTVTSAGLVAIAPEAVVPEVSIHLPLSTLTAVLTAGSGAAMRQVKLDGDAQFAQAVSGVAQHLRWDPEEDLSLIFGDVVAHRIHQGVTAGVTQLKTAGSRLGDNFAEYFLEEDRQLVRPRDLISLAEAVRVLRDDLARFEKHLERLERRGRT